VSESKNILLTGAAGGIGAETAEALVAAGHRVVVCDLEREAVAALADRLGDAAVAMYLDVRQAIEWERAASEAWQRFGHIDVLINNAAIASTGALQEIPSRAHAQMLDVNVMGVIHGIQAFLPRFQSAGGGHIINIASFASFIPMPGLATYAASKHAVRALSEALALELEDGPVRVTVISPGAVETPMLAAQRKDPWAALSFSDDAVPPSAVARAIVKAVDTRCAEIFVPPTRGKLLRVLAAFPGLMGRVLKVARQRGAERQRKFTI
jgi:NADP-dependent 3-hydroxy acid dehydrogenase YdfG